MSETEGNEATERLVEVEKLVKMYLAYPLPEIRERILRRFYNKLRIPSHVGNAAENSIFSAKFILRKGMLNQLINGLLINRDLAETEESKL